MLLATLNEILQDLRRQCTHSATARDAASAAVSNATLQLTLARDQEARVIREHDRLRAQYTALRDYVNGLLSPVPPAFIEKIQQLGSAQADAFPRRQEASGIVRDKQDALKAAEREAAIAQEHHTALQKQLEEVRQHIQRVQDSTSALQ